MSRTRQYPSVPSTLASFGSGAAHSLGMLILMRIIQGLAAALLGGEVSRQAYLMAFIDIFAFLAAALALSLPFVVLMRQFKGGGKRPLIH